MSVVTDHLLRAALYFYYIFVVFSELELVALRGHANRCQLWWCFYFFFTPDPISGCPGSPTSATAGLLSAQTLCQGGPAKRGLPAGCPLLPGGTYHSYCFLLHFLTWQYKTLKPLFTLTAAASPGRGQSVSLVRLRSLLHAEVWLS